MCSIGWMKLEDGWLLFKNRDLPVSEKVGDNYLEITDNAMLFKERNQPGAWLGINRHGLGVATALGVPKKSNEENLPAVELVLQKAKTPEEARKIYPALAKDLECPYNLIFADSEKAFCMEQIGARIHVEKAEKRILRTNHFENLKEFNKGGKELENSKKRLEVFKSFTNGKISVNDILQALKYRLEENPGSLNRIDDFVTVASAVVEVKGKNATVHYVLNKAPHRGSYIKKEWNLD